MAAINTGNLTLLDNIKRTDPDGGIADAVEYLTMRAPILQDAVFREGNLPTGHEVTARTGLPALAWRRANEGVAAGKSSTDQYTETCGMLEGLSKVDRAVARLNGNEAAFRADEERSFLTSMRNEFETGVIYHSTKTNPERFNGLAGRFDATANPGGQQIVKVDAAASGNDSSSAWLVGWGDKSVYCVYPKGSVGGIEATDMGLQMIDDGTGKQFVGYVTNWAWRVGLVVEDFRNVVRVCNIDATTLAATGSALIVAMINAYHQLNDHTTRMAWYVNRRVATYLHLQALDSTKNSTLSIEKIGGQPVTMFLGIPVRTTDAILNTEAPIT